MVYYLVSILPGLIEFPFMKGEKGEKQKKVATLMDTIFDDLTKITQDNYDFVMKQAKDSNPIDRVVPVEGEIEVPQDIVLPYENIKKIIEKHYLICVTYCYCRNWMENLNNPCKIDKLKQNCFFHPNLLN